MRRHPVHGRVVLHGVDVPDDLAALGDIGPQVAVQSSGEHHARDRGHRSRLRGAASRPISAARMCRVPDDLARRLVHRIQPAALARIEVSTDRSKQVAACIKAIGLLDQGKMKQAFKLMHACAHDDLSKAESDHF
jgi:hypothetical protein